MSTLATRLREFFALEDPWERPGYALSRGDVLTGVVVALVTSLMLELVRAGGVLKDTDAPVWVQQGVAVTGALLLVGRRRWPLTVATLAAVHMFVVGLTMPAVMGQATLQVTYWVAIFSGVAWARSRTSMALVVGTIVAFMFGWIAVTFAVGHSLETEYGVSAGDRDPQALLGPITSAVLVILVVNIAFFSAALVGGQASWRRARQRLQLTEQAETIAAQAESLRRQAVVEERLRIARELHDVVAHHVSVIGIHAAAGRRVMDRDPEATRTALVQVEESTREAVGQMRGLLGALREVQPGPGPPGAGATPVVRAGRPRPAGRGAHRHPALGQLHRDRGPARCGRRRAAAAVARALPHRPGGVDQRGPAQHRDQRPPGGTGGPARGRADRARRGGGHRRRQAPEHPAGRPEQRSGPARHPRTGLLARRHRRDRAPGDRRLPGARPPPAGRRPRGAGRMSAPLRVLLVDDQHLVRSGFRLMLSVEDDLEVVGEAADGQQAVARAAELRPDVVLMDVQMPVMDGITATAELVRRDLGRVIILTTFDRDDYLFDALRAGASGFLLKNAEPEQLIDAVRAVGLGHALLAPEVTRRVIEQMTAPAPSAATTSAPAPRRTLPDDVTGREREVLVLIARGLSNTEIAAELFIGEATVKTHVSHLLAKLQARDRVHVVVFAYEAGLVPGVEDGSPPAG